MQYPQCHLDQTFMVRWAHAWSAETCIRKISGARKRCAEEPSRPVASPQAGPKTPESCFLHVMKHPGSSMTELGDMGAATLSL